MKLILDGNGADDLTEQPHGTRARHDRQDLSYLRSALRGDDAAVDTRAPERLNKVGRRVSALTKRSTPAATHRRVRHAPSSASQHQRAYNITRPLIYSTQAVLLLNIFVNQCPYSNQAEVWAKTREMQFLPFTTSPHHAITTNPFVRYGNRRYKVLNCLFTEEDRLWTYTKPVVLKRSRTN